RSPRADCRSGGALPTSGRLGSGPRHRRPPRAPLCRARGRPGGRGRARAPRARGASAGGLDAAGAVARAGLGGVRVRRPARGRRRRSARVAHVDPPPPVSEPAPEADVSAARRATQGLVRKVLIGTVLGALVLAGLSLYADVSALAASLGAFAWSAFALARALATGNYVLRYLRWQYYLRRIGVDVPHRESALVFLSGFVMSVTPGKLGEVFKSLLLYESRGTSIARSAPVVFAERLTDLIALVLLTALGCLSFEEGVPIAIGGALVVAVLLLASAWRPLGERLLSVAARLPLVRR